MFLGDLIIWHYVNLTNGIVDQTIELELPQKLVIFVMATCPKSTACLGARIGGVTEIKCVFEGPVNMRILLISPMEL